MAAINFTTLERRDSPAPSLFEEAPPSPAPAALAAIQATGISLSPANPLFRMCSGLSEKDRFKNLTWFTQFFQEIQKANLDPLLFNVLIQFEPSLSELKNLLTDLLYILKDRSNIEKKHLFLAINYLLTTENNLKNLQAWLAAYPKLISEEMDPDDRIDIFSFLAELPFLKIEALAKCFLRLVTAPATSARKALLVEILSTLSLKKMALVTTQALRLVTDDTSFAERVDLVLNLSLIPGDEIREIITQALGSEGFEELTAQQKIGRIKQLATQFHLTDASVADSLNTGRVFVMGNIHTDPEMREATLRFLEQYGQWGALFLTEGAEELLWTGDSVPVLGNLPGAFEVYGWDNMLQRRKLEFALAFDFEFEKRKREIIGFLPQLNPAKRKRIRRLISKLDNLEDLFEKSVRKRDESLLRTLEYFSTHYPSRPIFVFCGEAHLKNIQPRLAGLPDYRFLYFKHGRRDMPDAQYTKNLFQGRKFIRLPSKEAGQSVSSQLVAQLRGLQDLYKLLQEANSHRALDRISSEYMDCNERAQERDKEFKKQSIHLSHPAALSDERIARWEKMV